MDRTTHPLPAAGAHDPHEIALREIHVAIAMVVAGAAVTITLACLVGAESVAFAGAAWAQAAGVAFRVRRDAPDAVFIVVGPALATPPAPLDDGGRS